MIKHTDSPALCTQNTCVMPTLLCYVAKTADVLWSQERCAFDLRQYAKDLAQ
jgi:hypothetical protein